MVYSSDIGILACSIDEYQFGCYSEVNNTNRYARQSGFNTMPKEERDKGHSKKSKKAWNIMNSMFMFHAVKDVN